ncbi:hypothetical protein D3C76_844450 [compost metagenome]
MADQHEVARERFLDLQFIDEVTCGWRLCVKAVGHHFTVGQAVHAGLVEGTGGACVEMYATVPEAVAAQRVVAGGGLGQMSQLLQRVARILERVAPVVQRRRRGTGFRWWRDWPCGRGGQDWHGWPFMS